MAESKCGSCGNGTFEARSTKVRDLPTTSQFVQCAKCGVVVGVVEGVDPFRAIQALEERLSTQIKAIATK